MNCKTLAGTELAKHIICELKEQTQNLSDQRPPGLAVVLVGEDPASKVYVRMKTKRASDCGIQIFDRFFPENTSEETLLNELASLNHNTEVDGILVQLPLPKHINTNRILDAILPEKDVDGLTTPNLGKLISNREDAVIPCTPKGIHALLKHYSIPLEGKHVVVVGRSQIVGMPLSILLSQNRTGANATVTITHSKTQNIKKITEQADVLIVAIGKAEFITKEMVKKGATVIDVGVNRKPAKNDKGYTLVGDVASEVSSVASGVTPVPGGIGPLTIAMLLKNTIERYLIHVKSS